MTLHLFNVVSARTASREIFGYLNWLHLAAAALVLVAGGFSPLALSTLLFVAVSWLVNRWPRYGKSPFALAASVTTAIYFVLPLAFIAATGERFEYGRGLAELPFTNEEYAQVAPRAILYLTLLFGALACAVALTVRHRDAGPNRLLRHISPEMSIGLLGLLVVFIAYRTTNALIEIRLTGTATPESLWAFIFFDAPYLMLLPILVSARLAVRRRRRTIEWQFAILLLLFFAQSTFGSTSKGFILTLAILSFIIPLSYLEGSRKVWCLMPSRRMLAVVGVASIGVFFVAQALRVAVFTGEGRSVAAVVSALASPEADTSIPTLLSAVGYRMSAAVDRYILIFDAHLDRGHSGEYTWQYGTYLVKNFVNLVMPGSPYPEAYMPSSNLLVPVLFGDPLMGESSKEAMLRSLNTQPFTVFGVAILLAGRLAPLAVFLLMLALGATYHLVRGLPLRLALIYLFVGVVHSYGIEVAAANAIHVAVSLFIFMWLMRGVLSAREWLLPDRRRPFDHAAAGQAR